MSDICESWQTCSLQPVIQFQDQHVWLEPSTITPYVNELCSLLDQIRGTVLYDFVYQEFPVPYLVVKFYCKKCDRGTALILDPHDQLDVEDE